MSDSINPAKIDFLAEIETLTNGSASWTEYCMSRVAKLAAADFTVAKTNDRCIDMLRIAEAIADAAGGLASQRLYRQAAEVLAPLPEAERKSALAEFVSQVSFDLLSVAARSTGFDDPVKNGVELASRQAHPGALHCLASLLARV